MVEMGEAFTSEVELGPVVTQLVERLPGLLGVHFAALYLIDGDRLRRVAGPSELPEELPSLRMVYEHLQRKGALVRMDELAPLRLISSDADRFGEELVSSGVEVIGLVASTRRSVGLMVLSGTTGQTTLEHEELQLLRGLLNQASIALETSLLLDERARQAEFDRELKIAAAIQSSLLPDSLATADGWELTAVCLPAREIGGDFFTELPGGSAGERALAYADVSGKSISGALMMMAAHEVLHSLALAHPDPEELLLLANSRLHNLRRRGSGIGGGSFVALGYLAFSPGSGSLRYSLAGQPPPLIRRDGGGVEELRLPDHRLPLGAFSFGGHQILEATLGPGDLLLAFSDGVVDARSPDGELFGEDRLHEVLTGCPTDPRLATDRVLEAVEDFSRGNVPYDDVTLVAARWLG
jgi:serine phosphatase RsbU (regulator of sigma subunit)